MGYFVKLSSTGAVDSTAVNRIATEGYLQVIGAGTPAEGEVLAGVPLSVPALATSYLLEGVLVPRPVTPKPVLLGTVLTFPSYPAGTVIVIADQTGGEVLLDHAVEDGAAALVVDLPDAGVYVIEAAQPFPFIDSELRVILP
ncbi:hypothetical protein [Neptunicoccus cionae]|uniref:Uncharacterized protein n=1 Tax=Neptunicoccus cionae TaxID=2035344 RepID=A0A916QZM6_9RHOB|nr:hypothetical protein [Amylibacter cionae]GGA23880.1 hypothetical protein GCM10011498_26010 [Amylibacter cionae]